MNSRIKGVLGIPNLFTNPGNKIRKII